MSMLLACSKQAPEINITDNWVRATAEGQDVGAAYMTITSASDTSLVKVESSASDSIEIHSMSMENGVMKMRMLEQLDLKAKTPNKLAPGGFHLMLFDLKNPLKAGETVSFSLHFKNEVGKETLVTISSPILTEQP
ncbi:MAG: copper chaperone PCu(A)C [Burkholderiaceae bacterium]|nr:copper chaperone PCu(A)C [Burkholderiaceae bacterium]